MDPNLVLWILQVLLALAFFGAGVGHIRNYDRIETQPRMRWVTAVGRDRLRIIGVLEVLGAIGVVLPGATGVLPWLVPVAAASLALSWRSRSSSTPVVMARCRIWSSTSS